jgi:NADPH-dependent 2,4-dienoyl-CoA reductase/sulfur reductase-like enzyme
MPRDAADIVVIGAGPAGIAAAARAAESRRKPRVVVIDEGHGPGGQIWRPLPGPGGSRSRRARRWIARLERSGALVHRSTTVVDVRHAALGGAFVVMAESSGRGLELEAGKLVIATGARERFLPFPGWTLPNVIGVGGAQALMNGGAGETAPFRDKRVVIAGSGPLLLAVAASLSRAGAHVALVAEQAPPERVCRFAASLWRSPSRVLQAALYRAALIRTPYVTGTWIAAAYGGTEQGEQTGHDDPRVRSVAVSNGRSTRTIACDVLCAAFGLVPNTEVAHLLGCRVEGNAVVVDETQATSVHGVLCAGEPTGIGGVDQALIEGEIAGAVAAGGLPDARLVARRRRYRRDAAELERAFALRPELLSLATPDTIVCRCEDVPLGAIDAAWTPRQAKLYTRAGMGPCQGRVCGAALECLIGPAWTAQAVRPPLQPARLGTFLTAATTPQSTEHGAH